MNQHGMFEPYPGVHVPYRTRVQPQQQQGQPRTPQGRHKSNNNVGVTARSAIRHRPIGSQPLGEGTLSKTSDGALVFASTTGQQLIIQRGIPQNMQPRAATRAQAAYHAPDTEDEDEEVTTAIGDVNTRPVPSAPRRKVRCRPHWLLILGVGMLLMLTLWEIGSMALNWWNTTWNTIDYGFPRTYQLDGVVGHNHDSPTNPSHLIIINLNRKIEVIELPGGDASHALIYTGPTLIEDGSEYYPVTAKLEDVNGDGKPDLVLSVQGAQFVWINTGTGFRPATQADQVHM